MVRRFVALAYFFGVLSLSHAQQALPDSLPPSPVASQKSVTPQSAWIDLRQNTDQRSTTQSAPDWVEAVSMTPTLGTDGNPRTIFRIRLSQPAGNYHILFFRLFFEDKANARPELTAWDESGSQILHSGQLGTGMVDLPTSQSVVIPMSGVSAIDVEVPGDGKTIRGAYVDWMTSSEVVHPVNTDAREVIPEPFSASPALPAPTQDKEQFGTVTASLSADTIPIKSTQDGAGAFQFSLEAQPLLAVLTFEVASPRIDTPPEVYVNGEDVGPANLSLPELADPGYRGQAAALVGQMHFQYTGWLRAQKVIPAASLKVGSNDVTIANGDGAPDSAIRSTQIQLKYLWEKSDYVLHTGE